MNQRIVPLALAAMVAFAACDTPPIDTDPQELITEVIISLIPEGGGTVLNIIANDADGDGTGLEFAPARLAIPAGRYTGRIQLRDNINSVNVTEEIEELAEEHLFRYTLTPFGAGSITITDSESDYAPTDDNGGDFDVGLTFDVTIEDTASGNGAINVTLFHFDEGPKASNTATSDELDIDVDFPVSFN